eukprot:Amastigsp_a1439_94.p4 type:complete len:168 gc:universal Amastigsp_a1439_94:1133-1636(+)
MVRGVRRARTFGVGAARNAVPRGPTATRERQLQTRLRSRLESAPLFPALETNQIKIHRVATCRRRLHHRCLIVLAIGAFDVTCPRQRRIMRSVEPLRLLLFLNVHFGMNKPAAGMILLELVAAERCLANIDQLAPSIDVDALRHLGGHEIEAGLAELHSGRHRWRRK